MNDGLRGLKAEQSSLRRMIGHRTNIESLSRPREPLCFAILIIDVRVRLVKVNFILRGTKRRRRR